MDMAMFLVETQAKVKTTKMTETELPDRIKPFYDFIEKIHNLLEEVPPIEQPMRFGNKAFKTWIDKINASIDEDIAVMM